MDGLGNDQRDILSIRPRRREKNTGTFAQAIDRLDALACRLQALLDAVVACDELVIDLLGRIEGNLCW